MAFTKSSGSIFIFPLLFAMLIISKSFGQSMSLNDEINRKDMDTTVSPTVDFFEYANGTWLKDTKIPAAYSGWGSFYILGDENLNKLKSILSSVEKESNVKKGSSQQLVGDFYYTGMDTVKIEQQGFDPIKKDLESVNMINNIKDFYKELVKVQLGFSNPLFAFGSGADAKDSKMNIAQLYQSGLGMPDRDYYLKDDNSTKTIREEYSQLITKSFMLIGYDSVKATETAKEIIALETQLAKASMSRVEERDPHNIYHKMTVKELTALSSDFNWNEYFTLIGASNPGEINVAQPEFFKEVSNVVKTTPMNVLKEYLEWNIIRNAEPYLSNPFVEANFNFYGKVLNGTKEMQPRWKRVLGTIDGQVGMELGKLFVAKYFPPYAKKRALDLVHNLMAALRVRIEKVEWMSPETKTAALKKLSEFTVKIGYPDKWKSYKGLDINRDSYFGNVLSASIFNSKKDIAKIGKPVDKTEWGMTPQTVNAYYNPENNEIVFPAGILQPPFFDPKADDAINYGGIGAVIGHEMTHGFDDQGRQYDGKGNMKDWWTKTDEENFDKRAQRIVDQFDSYVAVDTLHINGKLTEGENIADLGGINISFDAFMKTPEYKSGKEINGFTPSQRFFLSFANIWKIKNRPERLRLRVKVDPHSPEHYRVDGPLSNTPAFWKAFNVKPGDPMRSPEDKLVKIW
ncbi:MAG TPA: M13 family metallopeptidase [Ignavibacteriaceae bacterium]|nr:M13 family metallopeptidase [Ignavibacteriaceae bacterium]